MKKKFLSLSVIAIAVIIMPFATFASNSTTPTTTPKAQNIQGNLGIFGKQAFGTDQPRDIRIIVGSVISSIIGILGILLTIYLLYGGFKWMTANGDDKQVEDAKAIIRNAVIGLAIIMTSYALTQFIIQSLTSAVAG
jgi:hypothetical protein